MHNLTIINPCSEQVEKNINYLVDKILSDDFSALKNKNFFDAVLNACSQHIANIIFASNKKLKIVNILEILRTEHDVFKKLSYRNFRDWYNDFVKNYDEYQKSYLSNAEFFQKANEYAKSLKSMKQDSIKELGNGN